MAATPRFLDSIRQVLLDGLGEPPDPIRRFGLLDAVLAVGSPLSVDRG
jgi:hypothetical protein